MPLPWHLAAASLYLYSVGYRPMKMAIFALLVFLPVATLSRLEPPTPRVEAWVHAARGARKPILPCFTTRMLRIFRQPPRSILPLGNIWRLHSLYGPSQPTVLPGQ